MSVLRSFGPWLWITGELNREEQEIAVANELAIQATLVRELFANPFRPVTINPSQLSSTVKNLGNQSTLPEPLTECRSWVTLLKTLAVRMPISCIIAVQVKNTFEAAGSSICSWGRSDRR
jgi:hypothetical protein